MKEDKNMPTKSGWFWVKIDKDQTLPCWFEWQNDGEHYFLAGGLGDDSSNGIYEEDIIKVGPEIIKPSKI